MGRIILCLTALLALSACETVNGAGKDIQHAGQTIQGAAKHAQAEM